MRHLPVFEKLLLVDPPCVRHTERTYNDMSIYQQYSREEWATRAEHEESTVVVSTMYGEYNSSYERDETVTFRLLYEGTAAVSGRVVFSEYSIDVTVAFGNLEEGRFAVLMFGDEQSVLYKKGTRLRLCFCDDEGENYKEYLLPLTREDEFDIKLSYFKDKPKLNLEIMQWIGDMFVQELEYHRGFIK